MVLRFLNSTQSPLTWAKMSQPGVIPPTQRAPPPQKSLLGQSAFVLHALPLLHVPVGQSLSTTQALPLRPLESRHCRGIATTRSLRGLLIVRLANFTCT